MDRVVPLPSVCLLSKFPAGTRLNQYQRNIQNRKQSAGCTNEQPQSRSPKFNKGEDKHSQPERSKAIGRRYASCADTGADDSSSRAYWPCPSVFCRCVSEFELGSVGTPSSLSAVPTAATPAATTAAFATFFATVLSFDRLFGLARRADALAFAGARPFNFGVARLAEDLDLALVPFARAFALPRLAGFFIIPSRVILTRAY